jgi:hypothetical protein
MLNVKIELQKSDFSMQINDFEKSLFCSSIFRNSESYKGFSENWKNHKKKLLGNTR